MLINKRNGTKVDLPAREVRHIRRTINSIATLPQVQEQLDTTAASTADIGFWYNRQNVLNLLLQIASGAIVYIVWVLCVRHDGVRAIRQDILSDLAPLLKRIEPAVDETSS